VQVETEVVKLLNILNRLELIAKTAVLGWKFKEVYRNLRSLL
jgi:hypothetical protein